MSAGGTLGSPPMSEHFPVGFRIRLPATAKKLVMVHMWLKLETMKESVKWEADLLEHTDEDQTWEQLTSLDEDED